MSRTTQLVLFVSTIVLVGTVPACNASDANDGVELVDVVAPGCELVLSDSVRYALTGGTSNSTLRRGAKIECDENGEVVILVDGQTVTVRQLKFPYQIPDVAKVIAAPDEQRVQRYLMGLGRKRGSSETILLWPLDDIAIDPGNATTIWRVGEDPNARVIVEYIPIDGDLDTSFMTTVQESAGSFQGEDLRAYLGGARDSGVTQVEVHVTDLEGDRSASASITFLEKSQSESLSARMSLWQDSAEPTRSIGQAMELSSLDLTGPEVLLCAEAYRASPEFENLRERLVELWVTLGDPIRARSLRPVD